MRLGDIIDSGAFHTSSIEEKLNILKNAYESTIDGVGEDHPLSKKLAVAITLLYEQKDSIDDSISSFKKVCDDIKQEVDCLK